MVPGLRALDVVIPSLAPSPPTSVAAFARVARSEVLRVRQAVFVEASRASGARWYSVLGRHVLPNAAGPVIVLATLDFGSSILAVRP